MNNYRQNYKNEKVRSFIKNQKTVKKKKKRKKERKKEKEPNRNSGAQGLNN